MPRDDAALVEGFPDSDALIRTISALCAQSSESGTEGPIADWVATELARIGLEVTRQEVLPGRFNVIGTLETGRPGPVLLFNGHLDTLPVPQGYGHPPFEPFVKDGRLYGAEINNMKGAVGAMIVAMAHLLKIRGRLCGRILLSAVMGECDTLGLGTLHMLDSGIGADMAINGEPTDLRIMTRHVGVTQIRIRARGVSVHVCRQAEGRNAVHALIPALAALDRDCLGFSPHKDFPGLPSLNIGYVHGGRMASMLADTAEALVDVRTVPGMTPESVLSDVRSAIARAGGARAVTADLLEPPAFCQQHPFVVDPDSAVIRSVARAHRQVLGAAPHVGPLFPQIYFGTDASHIARAGIATAIYGPGKPDEINVPDESMRIADLVNAARVYTLAAATLCARPEERQE